ncbi:MAG TPA: hypothetical protein VF596_00670 [Pyrinomonadaceae bacterium]|jgi:hypothetical protein
MSDISQDKHLKMLAERNRNERRKLLADLFGTAAYHYLSYAKDDDKKDAILDAFEEALRNFTRAAKESAPDASCPKGWTECVDGSCAPPGALCTQEQE